MPKWKPCQTGPRTSKGASPGLEGPTNFDLRARRKLYLWPRVAARIALPNTVEACMGQSADLSAALEFVVTRIDEQSVRSGEPLTDEQRGLLNNLPKNSDVPQIVTGDFESPPILIPRDTNYEKLIALARSAHSEDRERSPASRDWEFAISVLKLNRHPMNWLLQWAGVKQPRPWWDGWLLIAAAMVFAAITMTLILFTDGTAARRLALCGTGYFVLILISYLASRKIEERQLEQNIEACRASSRFADPSISQIRVIQ